VDVGADGKAHKCTLCYDRLQHGMEPACAQACPTDSIRFGEVSELMALADQRVADLREQGVPAYVYGKEEIVGGLNCFFLLVDEPEVYGLPRNPRLPSDSVPAGLAISALTGAVVAAGSVVAFRKERMDGMSGGSSLQPDSPTPAPGGGAPPGADMVAFMSAIHGANEAARARREERGSCGMGDACGCHP
jgi:formate dehydrogenase iron-sulfur subunit